ncbi:MAG: copper chaperone PCu(A)C [Pseudomonadales bacterium]|nr:copper chaperone PCu(A)C [Pseudomonadales bacterium]
MTMAKYLFCATLIWQLYQPAFAADMVISNAWSRATPAGAGMGAVYADFSNTSSWPLKIIRISTEVAVVSEVHESFEKDGLMRMREIKPFTIAPGATVSLRPGAKHIMLMKLKKPLEKGVKYALTAWVINASAVDEEQQPRSISAEVIVGGFGQMEKP